MNGMQAFEPGPNHAGLASGEPGDRPCIFVCRTDLEQLERLLPEVSEARTEASALLAEELERAQAQLEREWLDRLTTVGGRADELCRYAVLFGDPRLALTAVDRALEVTGDEVRAIAADRLRPDNRAVLVYEPTGAVELTGNKTENHGRHSD